MKGELQRWLEGPSFILQDPDDWLDSRNGNPNDAENFTDAETKREKTKKRKKSKRPGQFAVQARTAEKGSLETLSEGSATWQQLIQAVEDSEKVGTEEAIQICYREAQQGLRLAGLIADKGGLWCIQGRLGKAELPKEVKFPILLDRSSRITKLLVQDVRQETGHMGRRFVISYLHLKRGVKVTGSKTIFKET